MSVYDLLFCRHNSTRNPIYIIYFCTIETSCIFPGLSMRSAPISRPLQGASPYITYTEDMMPRTYQASDGSSPKSINDSCSSPKYFEIDPSLASSTSGVNVGIVQGRYST